MDDDAHKEAQRQLDILSRLLLSTRYPHALIVELSLAIYSHNTTRVEPRYRSVNILIWDDNAKQLIEFEGHLGFCLQIYTRQGQIDGSGVASNLDQVLSSSGFGYGEEEARRYQYVGHCRGWPSGDNAQRAWLEMGLFLSHLWTVGLPLHSIGCTLPPWPAFSG